MSEYQLRARIPHELADEIKTIIEETNEKFPHVEATFSSVAREALQATARQIKLHGEGVVFLELPLKNLDKSQLEAVKQGLESISAVLPGQKALEEALRRTEDRIEWQEFQEWKNSGKLPRGVEIREE